MNARATRVATTSIIAAVMFLVVGIAAITGALPVSALQGSDNDVSVPGLASQVEREGPVLANPEPEPTPGQHGIGEDEPTPEPTATPAPQPTATPAPTQPSSTFPHAVERWRPLVHDIFPAYSVDRVLGIMQCESNGNPNATGLSGEAGLMQIHPIHEARARELFGPGVNLYDPETNLRMAYELSSGGSNWGPWTCA